MRSKGTLMPNGAQVLGASAIRVKVRRTNGRPQVMQVLVHDVCLPKGLEFPAGSTCVLEANRPHVGAADRLNLGPATSLPDICPDWRDLRLMPVDDGFASTRFRFKVVGPDRRLLAVAEDVRVGDDGGGNGDVVKLMDVQIRDAREMACGLVEVDPEWDGSLPARILVSSAVRDARSRIESFDPELHGMVASVAVPNVVSRLFLEFDADSSERARRGWAELMRSYGIPSDRIARASDEDADEADRFREIRELGRLVTGYYITSVAAQQQAKG